MTPPLWAWAGALAVFSLLLVSLAAIVVVAGGAMAASVWRDRSQRRQGREPRGDAEPGRGTVPEPRGPVRT